ncbi:MAG: transketolase [Clostridiales bacterium]|nr:transketolase [Clostridiales bacterium]
MPLSDTRRAELEALCRKFRIDVLTALHEAQSGHPGGSLSVCEILTVIYFEKARLDSSDPGWADRDRIVLSKGHAAPMLYRILAEKGYFPLEEMKTLRKIDSLLQGHPSMHTPGVDISSGPLGVAFGAAQGMAIAKKLDGSNARVYAILGDGETEEGAVWEVAMSAVKFKLDNLTAVLDLNGVQLDGKTEDIMPLGDVPAKWRAFGWNVIECDGHDVGALSDAFDMAAAHKNRPTMIIAKTVKGKGVSFMEGNYAWHGKAVSDEDFTCAIGELGGECDA